MRGLCTQSLKINRRSETASFLIDMSKTGLQTCHTRPGSDSAYPTSPGQIRQEQIMNLRILFVPLTTVFTGFMRVAYHQDTASCFSLCTVVLARTIGDHRCDRHI